MTKFNPLNWFKRSPQVAVLRFYGPIGMSGRFSRGVSHPAMEKEIEAAFASKRIKVVVMLINSPGGSPAQSGLIARHIRRLADEKKLPVLAFCEDVAASGGYLLACAADEIIVDEYTVIGSIGVISASFGAVEAIDRIGIERRVHTAGKSKSMMDPFKPETEEDKARLDGLLKAIHERFIDWVKSSRGDKLEEGVDHFQGDVWVGQQAIDTGIADAIGHMRPVMRQRFGEDVKFKEFGTKKRSIISRLMGASVNEGLSGSVAYSAVNAAVDAVEERSMWSKYGL